MINKIGVITIIVNDINEAVAFYVEKLAFSKQQDTTFGPGTRWVTLSPKNNQTSS